MAMWKVKGEDSAERKPGSESADPKIEFLRPFELTYENFRVVMLGHVFGGAEQYLRWRFPTAWEVQDFKSALICVFPKADYVEYAIEVPSDMSVIFIVHLTDLGFMRACSTKPPPLKKTCKELLDEVTTNGVVTQGVNHTHVYM